MASRHRGDHAAVGFGVRPGALHGPWLLPESESKGHARKADDGRGTDPVAVGGILGRLAVRAGLGRLLAGRDHESGEVHSIEHFLLEMLFRDPLHFAQLLRVPCLKRSHEDATDLQQLVEVLRAFAGARADVDAVIPHSDIHVELVDVPLVELDAALPQPPASLARVLDQLGPNVNAVVDAPLPQELRHEAAEVPRAAADVQERHARTQGH
mmetsp:Transcript_53023/g.154437  ORF Transcript_53023/g.154437 Transcript_53023/m.154437 type:complete len:211 (-) Transcript_53023:297-929(-)